MARVVRNIEKVKQNAKLIIKNPFIFISIAFKSYRMYKTIKSLRYPEAIRENIGKPKIDFLLSAREPKLEYYTLNSKTYIDISIMYPRQLEVREDPAPYNFFADSLNEVDLLKNIKSITDIGCANGHLLNKCLSLKPDLQVQGIEFFNYQREAASKDIKNSIYIHDLRLPIYNRASSDLCICTEVGEHIDPASIDIFMENLVRLTNESLILTWSNSFPPVGAPPQHVNSLNNSKVKKLMLLYGFKFDKLTSKSLKIALEKKSSIYPWWLESISVYHR